MSSFLSFHSASRILAFFLVALLGLALVGPARAHTLDENSAALEGSADTDGDGVPDEFDNCISVPNAGSLACDTDMDGYGNACDGDLDNNHTTNSVDFMEYLLADFSAGEDSGTGSDMDCNGSVNAGDFLDSFLPNFNAAVPGPSGLACAGTVPCVPNAPLDLVQPSLEEEPIGVPSGSEHEHQHDDLLPIEPEEALRNDVELVAVRLGLDPADVTRHVRMQSKFNDFVAEVEQEFPEQFAGAQVGAKPGEPAVVFFKGGAPDAITGFIDESGLDEPVLVVGDQGFSAQEQQARARQILEVFISQGVRNAALEILPGGKIEVGVMRPNTGHGELELPHELREDVEVLYSDEPVMKLDHGRGGARVRNSAAGCPTITSGAICTSGFAVEHNDGRDGVTVAGHCSGIDSFIDPIDSPDHDFCLTHAGQHIGIFGDIEWKTSGHIEPNQFWARNRQLRTVTSRSMFLAPGTSTCLYGRTSNNRTCETVRSSFAFFIVDGTLASGFVTTNQTVSQGGDSGGPWSFSNRADGSNTGRILGLFGTRGVMSPNYLFNAALGVRVKTSP